MPKPVKKAVRELKVPPKTKRPSDPNLAAKSILEEHMARVQGQPAADQPILDPLTVIQEHLREAKGRKAKPTPAGPKLADLKRIARATAEEPHDKPPTFDQLYRARMAELGAKGGQKSGAKRMENLSAKDRKAIAKKGAAARWKKK